MATCYVKAYFDWIEQTAALSDAERGRLFIAILEYARSGLEPKLDGRESILFPVFRTTIDRDNKISRINAENGARGGRNSKANLSELKRTEANRSEPKPTKEKDKEKDKEEDKDKEYTRDICARVAPVEQGIPFAGELRGAFQDWMRYKQERREAYKPTGLKNLVAQITNAAAVYGDTAVAGVIRDSMSSGYKGIMFDRLQHTKNRQQESTFRRVLREEYAKAKAEEGAL